MNLIKLQLLLLILLVSPPALWAQTWDPFEGSPQEYLQKGQPEEALRIMKSNPKWMQLGDSQGHKTLHYAVHLGNLDVTSWILENGTGVDEPTESGQTPLFFAKVH